MSIPFSEPFPAPTISAAGVAIPSAQGQATTITETKASIEKVSPTLPTKYHERDEARATETTIGTK